MDHTELEQAVKKLARDAAARIHFQSTADEISIQQLKTVIQKADRIAVLTGAGISTMSGIPDYRSVAFGMWNKKPDIVDKLNERTFQDDPKEFWYSFYELLQSTLSEVMPDRSHESLIAALNAIEPNEGHELFAWLEKCKEKEVSIITQNVDGLHQQAGNSHVIEFHGNIRECVCSHCGLTYNLADVLQPNKVPQCKCGGFLRPDAVFFGDRVRGFAEARAAVGDADLVIIAGTSLQVYPFNELPEFVSSESKLVLINREVIEEERIFDLILLGNIAKISRKVMNNLDWDD
ncbi:NAD-dependent deacetylase [Peribacillus deserti]|uniref:protein acetyllysine N-acetyltransferase n=1 Tax=Peribacillus deserti TaxID=673318 RepID=A0ABS2QGD9_9BACI|nr:Sir2 family NAD-dependent protein deacetylase [Peribacillus deserti]MBM7691553.1 NAD-dependent deacetylase [Peribacillus deserti]